MSKKLFVAGLNLILITGVLTYLPKPIENNIAIANIQADIFKDSKTIALVKADFNLGTTSTANKSFSLNIGEGGEAFNYSGTTNQTATPITNPWINLKASATAGQRFTQSSAAGSDKNKWRLTSITIDYSKHSGTLGQTNIVKINDITIFSYISTTNSTSLANLNLHSEITTYDFNFSDNITTFTIIPTYILYIQRISFTYTIDYSNC